MNRTIVGGLAVIAAFAVLGSVTLVRAADLGGNCCADLEERVAELEATTARKGIPIPKTKIVFAFLLR